MCNIRVRPVSLSQQYLLTWHSPQYTRLALYNRNAKLAYLVPEQRDDNSTADGTVYTRIITRDAHLGRYATLDRSKYKMLLLSIPALELEAAIQRMSSMMDGQCRPTQRDLI